MGFPVFDLHCDTADRLAWQFLDAEFKEATQTSFYGPGDSEDPSACADLAASHNHISLERIGNTPWIQCFACYVPDALSPDQALGFYRQVMSYLDGQIEQNAQKVGLSVSAQDIRSLLGQRGVVAVRSVENARMFALGPHVVAELAAHGVLMASLSWNAQGPLASGHDVEDAGLTQAGLDALRAMEENGMVLDVSHLNDRCFDDVAKHAQKPFVASHSNSRAVWAHKRNLTDPQVCEIRDRGGLIGLNFTRFFIGEGDPSFDVLSQHIEHMLDLGCEDVLALGSDFDGTTTPSFIDNSSLMPAFQQNLSARFGEQVARKVCAENALAFFEKNAR